MIQIIPFHWTYHTCSNYLNVLIIQVAAVPYSQGTWQILKCEKHHTVGTQLSCVLITSTKLVYRYKLAMHCGAQLAHKGNIVTVKGGLMYKPNA